MSSITCLLGRALAPLGRLDAFSSPPPHVTGFYVIDSLVAGEGATVRAAAAQLVLPAVTLSVFALAPIARMTRGAMLAVMSSDFVRAARAAGLAGRAIVVRYALRNAVLPVVTTLGMVLSVLLGAYLPSPPCLRPCSRRAASASATESGAAGCSRGGACRCSMRSIASRSRSALPRRSASSANRATARQRSRACSLV